MQTRSTDYSNDEMKLTRFTQPFLVMLRNYETNRNIFHTNKRIRLLNSIMLSLSKHFHFILNLMNHTEHHAKHERFFQTIRKKILEFQNNILDISGKPENNNPIFQSISTQFLKKCQKIVHRIQHYYNCKYSVILMKTNSDIYRLIMSYL